MRKALCAGLLLLLAACGPASSPAPHANIVTRGNGGDPRSLDPAFATTESEIAIQKDILTGLIADGPDGAPIPGMAEHWTISPDGLTWTFHLRDARWSDGAPVTAGDFVFAWNRVRDPATASPNAEMLAPIASARAVNPRTLVVTLTHPAPYLPQILTHPAAMPLPAHVLARDPRWTQPGHFTGNGAFLPASWIPGEKLTLNKNPRFYDAAHAALDGIEYIPTPDIAAAFNRFREGALDTLNDMPPDRLTWIRKNMPGALQRAPGLAVYYLAPNHRRAPFDDARIREAVSLALDRDAITQKIRALGEPSAVTLVPPAIRGYHSLPAATELQAARLARAQILMRAAGHDAAHPLHVSLLIAQSGDNRRLAAAIQAMLRAAYIDLAIDAVEPRIAYQRLRQHDFGIGAASWVADYEDADNILRLLLATGSPNNYSGYANPAFDALLARAQSERDPAARNAILARAEALALADFALIPWRFSLTPNLVHTYVRGWAANPRNVHPSRFLSFAKE